jgi:hypothetical protein
MSKHPAVSYGVANPSQHWLTTYSKTDRLELMFVTMGGTQTSPSWEEVASLKVPYRVFHSDSPHYRQVENVFSFMVTPISDSIKAAAIAAFTKINGKEKKTNKALSDDVERKAKSLWHSEIADLINDLLTSEEDPNFEAVEQTLKRSAQKSVETVLAPYAASISWAMPIAEAINVMNAPYRKRKV